MMKNQKFGAFARTSFAVRDAWFNDHLHLRYREEEEEGAQPMSFDFLPSLRFW
jgi:hypothetical protein